MGRTRGLLPLRPKGDRRTGGGASGAAPYGSGPLRRPGQRRHWASIGRDPFLRVEDHDVSVPNRITTFWKLTDRSIDNSDLPGAAAIDGEWRSVLPDGTEVVVQRHDQQWIVHCGNSHAISKNLDIALAQAVHAETDFATGVQDVHYSSWIRGVADLITSETRKR
jgi:hypothetical protein